MESQFCLGSLMDCKSLCALLIFKCKDNCGGQRESHLITVSWLPWILIGLIVRPQFIIQASLAFRISSVPWWRRGDENRSAMADLTWGRAPLQEWQGQIKIAWQYSIGSGSQWFSSGACSKMWWHVWDTKIVWGTLFMLGEAVEEGSAWWTDVAEEEQSA